MKFLSVNLHNHAIAKLFLSEERRFFFLSLSCCLALSLLTEKSFAWGGRGHDTICQTATFLVKEKELKDFLQARPQIMGHLCNLPDTQWRNESGDVRASGDPAHFIDPEILGFKAETLPLDLKKLSLEFKGKSNALDPEEKLFSIPRQLGSMWWRVDQMMRLLVATKKDFEQAKIPQNKQDEQNESLPYNQAVYRFLTLAGIMGHYVADAAQPWHNTADYDGFLSGHGGIHSYYENEVVSIYDGDLMAKVLKRARSLKMPGVKTGTVLEKMRAFSSLAAKDLEAVKKLDPVIKKSELKNEGGLKLKTEAQRKPASEVAAKMEPLITTQMARAAQLLADFWDEAYREAGRPHLKSYRSWRHPFKVDFISPDYE